MPTGRRSGGAPPQRSTNSRRGLAARSEHPKQQLFRRFPLTLRAVGLLVLSLVAVLLSHQLKSAALLAFAALCVVVVAASWMLLYLGTGSILVDRSIRAELLHVGERTTVRLAITDGSRFPRVPGQWGDRVSAGLVRVQPDSSDAGWSTPAGRPRTRVNEYTVAAVRRGRHRLGPLDLMFQDPFGLIIRRSSRGGALSITVLPELIPLSSLTPFLSAYGDGVARRPELRAGAGEDDVIARPYHFGDSIRRVNWRASAHRDELMVRQEEQENAPRAVLFLDTAEAHWLSRADSRGYYPAFEYAVSVVASFADLLSETGYNFQLVSEDELDLEIDGTLNNAGLEQAMFALATVLPRRGVDRFSLLRSALLGQSAKSVIAAFGSLDDSEANEVAGLAHLAGSAIAVFPDGVATSARTTLEAAGWQCHSVAAGEPLVTAAAGAWWSDTGQTGTRLPADGRPL
jgi:uncharacterized protein (DUF58 family)